MSSDDSCTLSLQPIDQLLKEGHHRLYIMTLRAMQQEGHLTREDISSQGTVVKGEVLANRMA